MRTMWTLDQALELVRRIQSVIKKYNYHVALGGGVLNRGTSTKDLDLYFLPINSLELPPRLDDLRTYLTTEFGQELALGGHTTFDDGDSPYPPEPEFQIRATYFPQGKRIDAFFI